MDLAAGLHTQRRWAWLAFSLVVLAIALAPLDSWPARPTERLFRIEAGSFQYSPPILRANPGDRITIELVALDVIHGIYIDGYNLDLIAEPGQTSRLSFIADRPGSYRFRCSVTCGALHPFMIGKLDVGTNSLFWKGLGIAFLAAFAGLWSVKK